MSPARGVQSQMVQDAHRRLQHLYEISNLLTDFQSAERTLSAAVALLRETLPVRTAVFVLKLQGSPRSVAWRDDDVAAAEIENAEARAFAAYTYLAGAAALPSEGASGHAIVRLPAQQSGDNICFLTLPLVVEHHSIFGVLELESAEPLNESHLV